MPAAPFAITTAAITVKGNFQAKHDMWGESSASEDLGVGQSFVAFWLKFYLDEPGKEFTQYWGKEAMHRLGEAALYDLLVQNDSLFLQATAVLYHLYWCCIFARVDWDEISKQPQLTMPQVVEHVWALCGWVQHAAVEDASLEAIQG